ncbi:MAG: recombinase family protein, partial [Patescibacteria group bacterium]
MKKAFIYARVSTEEQAVKGKSIEAQLRMCEQYAESNDIDAVDKYVDEGKSATNMNRPALQDMLGAIQDKYNQIEIILIQDTDRLARNTLDHLKIKAMLKKHDVTLISISQPTIDDSPEGNFLDTILAATNSFQSQITGRKTSKVLEQKALLGWYPGGIPPLGYKNADNPNPTCSLDKRIVVIDDSIAPYIKDIFLDFATGKSNYTKLAKHLNDLGIKSPHRNKVHPSLIKTTLENPFYIGQFYWKDKLYKNARHDTFVDEVLYEEVQSMMIQQARNTTRFRKHKMLLRGHIFYKDSGKQMMGEVKVKNGKTYNHYYCKHIGKGSYIDQEKLEKKVEKLFEKIQISEEYKEEILQKAQELLREVRGTRDEDKRRLQREITKYEKALGDAEDDRYLRNTITTEQLNSIKDKYTPLKEKVREELAKIDIDHESRMKDLERLLSLAEDIGRAYKLAKPNLKKEYLNLFFKKIWISKGKIVNYDL